MDFLGKLAMNNPALAGKAASMFASNPTAMQGLAGLVKNQGMGAVKDNPEALAALQNAATQGMQGIAGLAQNPALQGAAMDALKASGVLGPLANNPEALKALQGAAVSGAAGLAGLAANPAVRNAVMGAPAAASPLAGALGSLLGSPAPAAASPMLDKLGSFFGSSAGTGAPAEPAQPLTPQQLQTVAVMVASMLGSGQQGAGKRRKTIRKKKKLRRKTGRVTRAA
jgi:hypothetical protein